MKIYNDPELIFTIRMPRILVVLVCMLVVAMVFGCGGGDDSADASGTQPVDCQAKPDACR